MAQGGAPVRKKAYRGPVFSFLFFLFSSFPTHSSRWIRTALHLVVRHREKHKSESDHLGICLYKDYGISYLSS